MRGLDIHSKMGIRIPYVNPFPSQPHGTAIKGLIQLLPLLFHCSTSLSIVFLFTELSEYTLLL